MGFLPDVHHCMKCGSKTWKTADKARAPVLGGGEHQWRCTKKACRFKQHVLTQSPLFSAGSGPSSASLRKQARRRNFLAQSNISLFRPERRAQP